MPAVQG